MPDERPQTPKTKEKQKQKFKISKEQERRVVKYTLQYLDYGLVGSKACGRNIGNALYHELEPKHESEGYLSSPLGGKYGSKLCERNKELENAVKKSQELAQLRGKAATTDFKARLAECVKEYNIHPDDIYAVKEYGFLTRKTSSRQKMTLRRPPNPKNDARSLASTILCINNKGEFLTPYLITKGQKSSHFMSCAGVMLGSNPDAWADAFDFERWLEFFHSETRSSTAFRLRPWRLILVESHSSPISEKCFVMAIEERIIWFSYPKHKADDIDPFSCGVTHYFDRRYAEWSTGRWETKEASGEKMSQGMEIKTNHLGAALKRFTTDIEREVELRKAWKRAEEVWSLTKGPNSSDAITIPVDSGEEWDGEDEHGCEELGDPLQVKHEGSSNNPATGANMVDICSIQWHSPRSGDPDRASVEVICLDSDSDIAPNHPSTHSNTPNRGRKRAFSKTREAGSETPNTRRTRVRFENDQGTAQSQVISLPQAQPQQPNPFRPQSASQSRPPSEPRTPSRPQVQPPRPVSSRPQSVSGRQGVARPQTSSGQQTSSWPQGQPQQQVLPRPRSAAGRQGASRPQTPSEPKTPFQPRGRPQQPASSRPQSASGRRGASRPQAPPGPQAPSEPRIQSQQRFSPLPRFSPQPRTGSQAQASSVSRISHQPRERSRPRYPSQSQSQSQQRSSPPSTEPSQPRTSAHRGDSYRPRGAYQTPAPNENPNQEVSRREADRWRPSRRRGRKNRRRSDDFIQRKEGPSGSRHDFMEPAALSPSSLRHSSPLRPERRVDGRIHETNVSKSSPSYPRSDSTFLGSSGEMLLERLSKLQEDVKRMLGVGR